MALEDVPGQQRAAALLRAALQSGRLAHAYLFVGPSGVGRLAMARELASVLLCLEGRAEPLDRAQGRPFGAAQGKRCGACKSCRSFDSGNHPDYHEAGVPEGKQELPIGLIQMLQDQAFVKPHMAPRRVFVLREAEKMNLEAANCFLKTLEEPPGGGFFILIATTLWDMPQTARSRCQVIRFSGLPAGRVEEVLRREGFDADDAWWLARRCWGSPGLALSFRDVGLHSDNRELVEKLLALSRAEGPALAEGDTILNGVPTYGLTDWLSARADDAADSRPQARAMLQELLECAAVFYRDLAVVALRRAPFGSEPQGRRQDKAIAPGEPTSPHGDTIPNGVPSVEVFNKGLEERLREMARELAEGDTIPNSVPAYLIECADRVFDAIERVGANANRQVALDDLFTQLSVIGDQSSVTGGVVYGSPITEH